MIVYELREDKLQRLSFPLVCCLFFHSLLQIPGLLVLLYEHAVSTF